MANLQAGALEIIEYILPTDVEAVKRDPKWRIATNGSLAFTGISINVGNGPAENTILGQNKLVRQAFELSIDRDALVQVVFNNMNTPTAQANPRGSAYYVDSRWPPPRDIAKAKALLAQAGVKTPVPVVMTITNETDIQQASEVIQSMAREAGFEAGITHCSTRAS